MVAKEITMRCTVLGAGSWGTALASLLATRRRTFVRLYNDLKSRFEEYSA